jgi:arginine-tRNA-protein transferase
VGVALADVVLEAISSVYFFHDPKWRSSGPGVFSILTQQRYAAEKRLRYQYLGYWISQCRSMSYKSLYQPHEILTGYPADHEDPVWTAPPLQIEPG